MKRRSALSTALVTALTTLPLLGCSDVSTDAGSGGTGPGSAGTLGSAGTTPQTSGGSSAGTAAGMGGGTMSASGAGGGASGGGSGGAGGNGGASSGGGGNGGSGGSGGAMNGPKKSAGCGTAATQALNQWVDGMVMTGGANRPYSVRLPTGYDPMRAYPVIVLLHGCGGGTNNVPMEKATGSDAILVRGTGSAADTCWNTSANGPDVAFFDAMVAGVKARFCADESRFFVVGYSSGSWLVNQLTCIRASVLRGGASVTGGESASGNCGGPVARIFIHDEDDTTNVISGSVKARDRQLTQNMCDKAAQPMAVDPSPCTLYQGCATGYPVEWCQTMGEEHNRQDSFAPSTFWNFFKAL
jgi:polyhydroxybutyrate depolymerase